MLVGTGFLWWRIFAPLIGVLKSATRPRCARLRANAPGRCNRKAWPLRSFRTGANRRGLITIEGLWLPNLKRIQHEHIRGRSGQAAAPEIDQVFVYDCRASFGGQHSVSGGGKQVYSRAMVIGRKLHLLTHGTETRQYLTSTRLMISSGIVRKGWRSDVIIDLTLHTEAPVFLHRPVNQLPTNSGFAHVDTGYLRKSRWTSASGPA